MWLQFSKKVADGSEKNSLLAYYYNRQGAKWPGAEPDNKKSSKSFSRLTAFAGRVGGGWYSVFMTCPVVRQADAALADAISVLPEQTREEILRYSFLRQPARLGLLFTRQT